MKLIQNKGDGMGKLYEKVMNALSSMEVAFTKREGRSGSFSFAAI